jgi:nucleotide-binding universal stress UspA family protein
MKILLATDGSEHSRRAVEEACELLQNGRQNEFKIVSVVERVVPVSAEPFGASNEYYARMQADAVKIGRKAVAEAENIINERLNRGGFSVNTEVITGNVKHVIVEEAESCGADLIAVGSHGYGFFDLMMLGSVSIFVVHHAP